MYNGDFRRSTYGTWLGTSEMLLYFDELFL
jgi:hypothetical protein